ncbi:MAG: enoyl-CoA hydratase-related protein [Xanthomonadaceae bacterium]|nr:enoyl-CoA hydratase-related protein [Xanthomonadaceae bacterium]MDP2184000.1 enoyl-CoA hydratase-related protein [Xanthomonadales bacterium]MDZ4115998.1 enoyl-CoA hydratase-related protein [Xanthomonadaceae bacterium]MDZ4376787.1 enoyl-CoA hydratase-related protein [Xanthomonadaceae bacterium]
MDTLQSLRIEGQGAVAELVLLGPGRGNAMGPDFWRELPQAVAQIEADGAVRTIIVRGSGEHFSYGLDLPAMAAQLQPILGNGAAGRAAIITLARQMHSGFAALAASRLPVIAAIDGWCIGAGIELAAACDIRIASASAHFALREVNVGIVADLGGLTRLPHLIGEAWTRQLALTGDEIDAATAARIGLVTSMLADSTALLNAARVLAARIAANPPLVVAGIKQVMNARIAADVADGNREAATLNGMLMQSEDFAEAMRAFIEKRTPAFKGR